jgi:HK97 gp10 family phage protein
MKLDLSSCNGFIDAVGRGAEAQVRPAAQAAAQVLYEEVLFRVPTSLKGHWFHGSSFKKTGKKYYFDAGSLKAAIYQAFSPSNSGDARATYHVSWNYKKAPYGHMVNNGTPRAAAKPFLSNAWDARIDDATKAAEERFDEGLQGVIGAAT